MKIGTCKSCEKIFSFGRNTYGIYCSNKCQHDFQSKQIFEGWKRGEVSGWYGKTKVLAGWLRDYLLDKFNYSCTKCGWNKRHPVDNLPLVEVNHIDGDAENCNEDNLEVLCPNCHSMTPNFRRRNPNSKRIR